MSAHDDDVHQVAQALRWSIRRRQEAPDEPGSVYGMALAEVLAEALSGPRRAQMAAELIVGLRRHLCPYTISRKPGPQQRR